MNWVLIMLISTGVGTGYGPMQVAGFSNKATCEAAYAEYYNSSTANVSGGYCMEVK